jgi:hypothetical protein
MSTVDCISTSATCNMQHAICNMQKGRSIAHILALSCYMLLALVVMYPLPLHMGEQIVANGPGQVDGYLGIWNIWWTARALTSGQDPFVTPLLFYPQGLDLFWQTLSLPQGLLALPLTLALGPLPAYNALILLSFVLGGYFCFLFVRAALRGDDRRPPTADRRPPTADRRPPTADRQPPEAVLASSFVLRPLSFVTSRDLAALIGGAVYAFAPFHMQKVLDAQLEVAAIQWLPLWAWATMRLLERRRWPWALLSGLLLLWVGLGTWYYGLFALIATGAMAGLWAVQETNRARSALFTFYLLPFTLMYSSGG